MFSTLSLLLSTTMLLAFAGVASAGNDIDGKITVYDDFMLVDEDGRHITLTEGTHTAEFSYKIRKGELEIEIDDIDNGKDRDFEFQIPNLTEEDFRKESLELHFPNTPGDRELDTKMLVTNKILSKKGPYGNYYRCRERGSVIYSYRPVVFYLANRITHVVARISSDEETLALFEANRHTRGREIVWKGRCGDMMPENLEDVVPN